MTPAVISGIAVSETLALKKRGEIIVTQLRSSVGNKAKKWRNHEEYCSVQMWVHYFGQMIICLESNATYWYNPDWGISIQRQMCLCDYYIVILYRYLYCTSFTSRKTDKPYSTDLDMFGKHIFSHKTNDFDVDVPPVVFRRAFDNHSTWIAPQGGPLINRVMGEMAEPKLGFIGVISP